MNCEAGMRERPVNLFILVLLVSVAILGFHVRQFSRWSLYTKPFSHFYISTTRTHSILDKTCAHIMLTGMQ